MFVFDLNDPSVMETIINFLQKRRPVFCCQSRIVDNSLTVQGYVLSDDPTGSFMCLTFSLDQETGDVNVSDDYGTFRETELHSFVEWIRSNFVVDTEEADDEEPSYAKRIRCNE